MKDEKVFIDTNLIVYLYSKNDAKKQDKVISTLSSYDCLIIASALEANCKYLFSEDMQHGQIIENTLKIINPFVQSPIS